MPPWKVVKCSRFKASALEERSCAPILRAGGSKVSVPADRIKFYPSIRTLFAGERIGKIDGDGSLSEVCDKFRVDVIEKSIFLEFSVY